MANSSQLSKSLAKRLSNHRLFYVCRDIERAIGSEQGLKNYYIITNYSNLASRMASQYQNIIIIKNKSTLDTAELLNHHETIKTIKPKDFVLVFKNNAIIEKACRTHKWKLLNPSSQLADKVESKVSQVEWLGSLAKFLPPHQISTCAQIQWQHKKFILQFNHSHTGSGTFLIDSQKKLKELQKKFSNRPVRIMDFISGPVFTNNNVVWGAKTLIGNISYQITGLMPFTDNKFSTIGNDFALPETLLEKKQVKQYAKIVMSIGKRLHKQGWKGLFGADIIMDAKTKRLYLLEINARQPASTGFESQLQNLHIKQQKDSHINTFQAHFAALLGIKFQNYQLTAIQTGSQIVQRVTAEKPYKNINEYWKKLKKLASTNPAVINILPYNNTAPGSDLARIQLSEGIMAKHGYFNKLGKEIQASIC
ncbi:MAG: hypothetical protein HYT15_00260 [Candidatus Magasanikbacteria bacterium]|nr:hypothetical protein [Candidatus Magasanikbacteria bacterium]